MNAPLRILHVEDDPQDAELIQSVLAANGLACEIVRVDTREAFEAALNQGGFDLILSDFSLPRFDGLLALSIAQDKRPDLPFIFVSGMIGEELAVDTLQCGAMDYVLKDKLSRLPSAVRRALHEAAERAKRARLEDQFRQAQKLEAIGRLAAGVAREFNNMLSVITGYTELLLASLRPDDPHRKQVQEIHKAGERAAALTQQLLAFSRTQVLEPKVLDLHAVVANMEKFLGRIIGGHITLVTELEPNSGRVQADLGQLEHVLLTLAVNARDAMPKGGQLTISLGNAEVDESSANRLPDIQPGPYVRLSVSDTGWGLDEEARARIFEPLVVTKGPDQETGLGLSTVYGIVKQSGGTITVSSEPGKGSTFDIYLPRLRDEAAQPEPLPGGELAARPETILLVEDEELVRTMTRTILEANGYRVLEAGDGPEAIRLSQDHAGPIHLLVTDVVMPEMNGWQLSERLVPAHPEMKVLYMSAHPEKPVVQHGRLKAGTAFLQKPFTPMALARKVWEVLGSRCGPS